MVYPQKWTLYFETLQQNAERLNGVPLVCRGNPCSSSSS